MYLISFLLKMDDDITASMMNILCLLCMGGCLILIHMVILFLSMNFHIDFRYDFVAKFWYLAYVILNMG